MNVSKILVTPVAAALLLTFSCEGGGGGNTPSAPKKGDTQFNNGNLPNEQKYNSQQFNNSNGEGDATGASDDICGAMRNDAGLMGRAGDEVNKLCERIADLRNPSVVYLGDGNAKIIFSGEEIAGQEKVSRATILSSLKQKNKPEYFASKVKLEVSDPSKFKSDGFEMTPDETYIDFSTISKSDSETRFNYTNRTDKDVIIEYEGKSTFHTIIPGELYVIVSTAEVLKSSIREFKGVIVSHRHPSDPDNIEVFAYTKEAYLNFGSHEGLMSKLRVKFADEQTRGYRNGLHAADVQLNY